MKRLALVVPDGVGVRNFVLGPFLGEAVKRADVSVLHGLGNEDAQRLASGSGAIVPWEPFFAGSDPRLSMVLRKTVAYGHMYRGHTLAMMANLARRPAGAWRRRALDDLLKAFGSLAARLDLVDPLEQAHLAHLGGRPEVSRYRRHFAERRPSVVFSSNQRSLTVVPPVIAARSLGIPTAAFIFSWDNLTSKGRIAAPFDHFLVWSELMKQELLRFYPSVAAERVHIVGTPQFDPYANRSLLAPRADFFRRIGADPSRKLVCFSGGDAGTCPEDPEHVGILLRLVREGRVPGSPQIVLRPSPVDSGDRYERIRHEFPELLYAAPSWIRPAAGDWARVVPMPDDVAFLTNLIFHSDVNVNMASTMTLDFAAFDKPIVNLAFDVSNPPLFGRPIWDHYYRYDHYLPVVRLGAARFARSPDELAAHVAAYLEDPGLDREARRRLLDLEIGVPMGDSSRRVLDALLEIAA